MHMKIDTKVPRSLKTWFVVHFVADILFAVPLMFIPVGFLTILGWQEIDPIAARLVAAALLGIGTESLLSYRAPLETYRGMLNLKIIWSLGAITGITICLFEGAQNRPLALWLGLFIFIAFNGLWVYWKMRLSRKI